ncbi:hypothetical protein CFP65_3132 [Kitasatospora sp. MMS16-BH015]|uniref:DUF4291 domain-containing protein n=1 Tax=Kitasatospora sp. MMS16-BH015 TaxID=2018025 RepID=UPI000CA34CAF|nr:DUF4291 domain-containing protein [Kitasatospora sp. MMS16-BH015]AUG77939.1 hypothetical protein CFP65_3132 [Kitasatospora sp. MMS16-BH015]
MPTPVRQIRAAHDARTITVYQAFCPEIAGPAAETGRFPAEFSRERMTWIKPSFLWMMHRSDWGRSSGQQRVLAVTIHRDGFEWALGQAELSGYDASVHRSREEWRRAVRRSEVRVQWDPERNLAMQPQRHRSLQLGLRGEAVRRYAEEWITGIEDVSALAEQVRVERRPELLPAERPYPLPAQLAVRIGADG